MINKKLGKKLISDHSTKCTNQNLSRRDKTEMGIWDFEIQTDHLIPPRRQDLVIVNRKENVPKYLDLGKELKKLWKMKVTVTQVANGPPRTISKGLIRRLEELETRGQAETIQTTILLRSA